MKQLAIFQNCMHSCQSRKLDLSGKMREGMASENPRERSKNQIKFKEFLYKFKRCSFYFISKEKSMLGIMQRDHMIIIFNP